MIYRANEGLGGHHACMSPGAVVGSLVGSRAAGSGKEACTEDERIDPIHEREIERGSV
jgi:hypothetical protein